MYSQAQINKMVEATTVSEPHMLGQLARLRGGDRYYGCHFGMRSTRAYWQEQFYQGWDDVEMALRGVYEMPKRRVS